MGKMKKPMQSIERKTDSMALWKIGERTFRVQILPQTCSECGHDETLTGLPEPMRQMQPDKTNVVCHPFLGGCNHGFEFEMPQNCLCTRLENWK